MRTKEDVFAKHAREQTMSFVIIVSAEVQVTNLHGDVAAVQPVYEEIGETGGGYHRGTGSS